MKLVILMDRFLPTNDKRGDGTRRTFFFVKVHEPKLFSSVFFFYFYTIDRWLESRPPTRSMTSWRMKSAKIRRVFRGQCERKNVRKMSADSWADCEKRKPQTAAVCGSSVNGP